MDQYKTRDNIIILGIFALAIIGAFHDQWELATGCVTGGYALLKMKGDNS